MPNLDKKCLNILFLGDIVGRPGRKALAEHLPTLKETYNLDFVVVNGENAAAGRGLTEDTAKEIFSAGANAITLGDHTFDQKEIEKLLITEKRILRPINYVHGTPGRGFSTFEHNGAKIGVLNVIGRVFMRENVDCPFKACRTHMADYTLGEDYDALIVDAHTEATSEIVALGHIWDGHASLVIGTHTHIPTADTRIQPRGTAFQSDAGMCGTYNSSLGMAYEGVVNRFEKNGRYTMQPATGEGTLCGVVVTVRESGLASSVVPVRIGGVLASTEEEK